MTKINSHLKWTWSTIAILFIVGLFITSCSHFSLSQFSVPKEHPIEVDQPVWVKEPNKEAMEVKKGKPILLKEQPLFIESPGYVGVLLVPVQGVSNNIQVTMKPISNWAGEASQKYANKILSSLFSELTKVQVILGQRKAQQALDKVNELKKQYPNISYLRFVEASCLIMLGKKNQAKETLQLALEDYPDNKEAQTLYRSLASEVGE